LYLKSKELGCSPINQRWQRSGLKNMEVKSQKRLDDLPPSTSSFWDGEVNTGIVPKKKDEEKHYFELVSGREAQCKFCDWGFHLDPGDKIEGGHLYEKSGKLVI
jgi:hypothetical protein